MAKAKTMPKRTLTPQERQAISAEVKSGEAMLKATEKFGEGDYAEAIPESVTVNKDKIKAQIKHLQSVLDNETPRRLTNPQERDKALKERKRLEDIFKPYLETWQDLGAIRMDSPEYKEAYKKAVKRLTNPAIERAIEQWRELGKALEPDDSDINDLDKLRERR